MKTVYLLLGSNLDDRLKNMTIAKQLIEKSIGLIITKSDIYETAAWGKLSEPNYLNQVVICKTVLNPHTILNFIHQIEHELKRERVEKWGSRTMDIDILFYDDEIVDTENLTIPHPLIQFRKFVLQPLNEIIPTFIHPILKQTINQMLNLCEDKLAVNKIAKINE